LLKVIVLQNKYYPPVPETPKEYWTDSKWANEHFSEIAEKFPNFWVAVVDEKVVSTGKIISKVRKIAREKTGGKHFPVIFAEQGIHVY